MTVIDRYWAMPNKETFKIKPVRELLEKYVTNNGAGWIDFFARKARIAEVTNDINPIYKTDYNCDALALAKLQVKAKRLYDGVLCDWPYSMNQNKVSYNDFGNGHYCVKPTSMKYWSQFKNNAAKLVNTGGIVMTFGWNSMGFGSKRGFEKIHIRLIAHGGSRNDTIVVVERKL